MVLGTIRFASLVGLRPDILITKERMRRWAGCLTEIRRQGAGYDEGAPRPRISRRSSKRWTPRVSSRARSSGMASRDFHR